jgi:hypothetical protein
LCRVEVFVVQLDVDAGDECIVECANTVRGQEEDTIVELERTEKAYQAMI